MIAHASGHASFSSNFAVFQWDLVDPKKGELRSCSTRRVVFLGLAFSGCEPERLYPAENARIHGNS